MPDNTLWPIIETVYTLYMLREGTMATTGGIKLLQQRYSKLWTDEGWLKGQNFQPRSTDVFVVGSPKSGTTWLQQIVHQLSTGGDMDFGEVIEAVPAVESAHDLRQNLDGEGNNFPRCFKTHYWYPRCPKGAKYIFCVREPCACAYSYFHMLQGWFFEPREVSVDEYITEMWLTQGEPKRSTELASYFHHLASWWPHRNDPNVLLVFYEDLKECYESSVRSIAEFMGITDEGCIQVALERGTFEFMKQHSDKFGQNIIRKYCNVRAGLPETAGMNKSKVLTGSTTEGLEMLSAEVRSEIKKKWEAVVTPVTGCATYSELRAAWKKEKASS